MVKEKCLLSKNLCFLIQKIYYIANFIGVNKKVKANSLINIMTQCKEILWSLKQDLIQKIGKMLKNKILRDNMVW